MSLETHAQEGLTREFLDEIRAGIRDAILPKAAERFGDDAPGVQSRPGAKPSETAQSYYDYQPCCVSTVALLAAEGDDAALTVVRRVFRNTRDYLDHGYGEGERRFPLRRLLLHLALTVDALKDAVGADEITSWRAVLSEVGEGVLSHFNGLQEKSPALDNRGFGTGINHVALGAEGVWKAGEVLGNAEWQELAGSFVDRLVAYGHPDVSGVNYF